MVASKTDAKMKSVKVDNWPGFLLQRLYAMYQSGHRCDTILRFANEDDSVCVKVHGMVLNSCTKFFDLLPKHRVGPYTIMTLPCGIGLRELEAIINFLYTGQLDFKDGDPQQIYNLVKRLQVDILTKLLAARFKGSNENSNPEDMTLRTDKIEFTEVKLPRNSNIVMEKDEQEDGEMDEEEYDYDEEDEDQKNFASFAEPLKIDERPHMRRIPRARAPDPITLPSNPSDADKTKLKFDPFALDLDFHMKRTSHKRSRHADEEDLSMSLGVDDDVEDEEGLERVEGELGRENGTLKSSVNANADKKKSVVSAIEDDWDDVEGANEESEEEAVDEEPVAKKPRQEIPEAGVQPAEVEEMSVEDASELINKIPTLRGVANAGKNVKIVKKTIGKEEYLRMKNQEASSSGQGKSLARVVMKAVASPAPILSKAPVQKTRKSATSTSAIPVPSSTVPRYASWRCNLCAEIDRPCEFASLQQLKSHFDGTHDMRITVLCRVCGQDAPRRLLSSNADFVTYATIRPAPETHIRCLNCRYVVVMEPKRSAKFREPSPDSLKPVLKPGTKKHALQCKECNLTFRTSFNLSMHQRARHPKAPKGVVSGSSLIPLDQIALKAADGTIIELAHSVDGQQIFIPESEMQHEILQEFTYVPEGIEISESGEEQYVYVPVAFEGEEGSGGGEALQCFTVGPGGELIVANQGHNRDQHGLTSTSASAVELILPDQPPESPMPTVSAPVVVRPVEGVTEEEAPAGENVVLACLSGPGAKIDVDEEEVEFEEAVEEKLSVMREGEN